jgi:serine protease Do
MDSPAAQAGLRAGDQILQLNGKAPRSFIDFTRQLAGIKDQREISLLIQRGSERRTVSLRMVPEKSFFNAELIRKKTGATLQELTEELAAGMGLGRIQGLLIAGVDKNSPASSAGLERGMLVTSIDGQDTSSLTTAAKMLYTKSKGEKVQMEIVSPRQRGVFIEYRQFTAAVAVR